MCQGVLGRGFAVNVDQREQGLAHPLPPPTRGLLATPVPIHTYGPVSPLLVWAAYPVLALLPIPVADCRSDTMMTCCYSILVHMDLFPSPTPAGLVQRGLPCGAGWRPHSPGRGGGARCGAWGACYRGAATGGARDSDALVATGQARRAAERGEVARHRPVVHLGFKHGTMMRCGVRLSCRKGASKLAGVTGTRGMRTVAGSQQRLPCRLAPARLLAPLAACGVRSAW
jgi:hypothetical protein